MVAVPAVRLMGVLLHFLKEALLAIEVEEDGVVVAVDEGFEEGAGVTLEDDILDPTVILLEMVHHNQVGIVHPVVILEMKVVVIGAVKLMTSRLLEDRNSFLPRMLVHVVTQCSQKTIHHFLTSYKKRTTIQKTVRQKLTVDHQSLVHYLLPQRDRQVVL
jgi:hypothetical protein